MTLTDLDTFTALLDVAGVGYRVRVINTGGGPQEIVSPVGFPIDFWFLGGDWIGAVEPPVPRGH